MTSMTAPDSVSVTSGGRPGSAAPTAAVGTALPRLRDVAHAAARGVVAAMAMTGMRAVTGGSEILGETPPQAIVRQRMRRALRKVPRRRRDAAIELVHWAYGAAGGAGYAYLPSPLRGRPVIGPAYGLAIWAGFEWGVAPLLNLSQWRQRGRRLERLALVGDHLLYGLVLSEIRPAHKATR